MARLARAAAVVLAAGGGERYTGPTPKLLASFRDDTVVGWAIEHALRAGLDATVVVQGAVVIDAPIDRGVVVVDNPDWRQGQASSLAAAVAWASEHGFDAVVIGLGDQPLIEPAAWRAVAATEPRSAIAVATYDGTRGHPVRLPRAVWPILPTTGDAGARRLLAERPDLVVEIPCAGSPIDIDTVEDLEQWS